MVAALEGTRSIAKVSHLCAGEREAVAIVDPVEIEKIVEQLKRSGILVVPNSPAVGN
jgi:hypothetical protein